MSDTPGPIQEQLDAQRRSIYGVQERLREHSVTLSDLNAVRGDHARRLQVLERRDAQDHSQFVEIRLTAEHQARELVRIGGVSDDTHALLLKHIGDEMDQISRLSRRVTWAGAIGLLIVFALALFLALFIRDFPPLAALRQLFTLG